MAKDWKKNEITYLKRYAATKTVEDLAERFDRDAGAVRDQLAALGIASKDAATGGGFYDDPAVDQYAEGLKLLQKGKWKQAEKALNAVLETSDLPEVSEKARQMLKVCAARLSESADQGADNPFLLAVYHKNEGRYDEALKLCKKHGDDERFAYLEASVYALKEDANKTLTCLTRAAEMNPKNRVYAYHDPDFESVRRQPELEKFFQAS